ncbi:MAG: MAPEG family protein [Pseudomonadota bacterium]
MPPFSVSPIYAAVLAIILVVLSIRVISVRREAKVSVGDGGNEVLTRRVRTQANFAEYAPMGLLLIILAEGGGAPGFLLHGLGLMLTSGRILHALGMSSKEAPAMFRVGGMMLTFLSLLAGAVIALVFALI